MSDRYIVVVDAGSTRIRCCLFDSDGRAVAERSTPWSYVEAGMPSPYAREVDADEVWASTARLIAECVGDAQVDAHRIAAVTVTSQRQGVVFLDREGRVLYAGPNTDIRAVFEGGAIDEALGERVFEVTGRLPSFLFTAAKLRWFMQHRPAVYERIDRVATLADWMRYKLSGELVSERTLAAEAGMLDIRTGEWCTELYEQLDLDTIGGIPIEKAGTSIAGVLSRCRRRHGHSGRCAGRHCRGRYAVRPSWTRSRPNRTGGSGRRLEHTPAHAHRRAGIRRGATDLDGTLRRSWAVEPGEHERGRGKLVPVAGGYDVGGRGRCLRRDGRGLL